MRIVRCSLVIVLMSLLIGGALAQTPSVRAADSWTPAAPIGTGTFQATTLLPDGQVLLTGGGNDGGDVSERAYRYDPVADRWIEAARMGAGRFGHTSTLLPDGRVLVTGGFGLGNPYTHASAEIYDPVADRWTPAASMGTARYRHQATLLPDGRVLVTGGLVAGGGPEVTHLAATELYDPATDRWTPAASLSTARAGHTATLLPDGRVLIVGGGQGPIRFASTERYDPATDRWSAAPPLSTARAGHMATTLRDGQVLIVGGDEAATAERYDSATDSWTSAEALISGGSTATLLRSGRVLVVGGHRGAGTGAEVYDPANNQ